MAQIKYKEEQRLRQWDFLIVLGVMIVAGLITLIVQVSSVNPSRNLLLFMALGILVLSGLFYYVNTVSMIAKYNEKSIRLSMMPVGTVKRKIKWEDVVTSEIIDSPKESKLTEWTNQIASLDKVVSGNTESCLHLKLKNNEEVIIGCSNPVQLQAFVTEMKKLHPNR